MNISNFYYTQSIYSNNYSPCPSFGAHGKPIDLKYIIKTREKYLPERIANSVKEVLAKDSKNMPSLLELHKETYAPLLNCKTLDEAKQLFPEFQTIDTTYQFQNNCKTFRSLNGKSVNEFALDMLKKLWAEVRNKDDIAKDMGLKSRTTLNWILNNINFVAYTNIYKILLKSSDKEMNAEIASKSSAWNLLHSDIIRERNKFASKKHKTPEYRKAQSERLKAYDIEHPERKEKIGAHSRKMWANAPEVKKAIAEYTQSCPDYVRVVLFKKMSGKKLTEAQRKIYQGYLKGFWNKYPELKKVLSEACAKAKETK
ncbi:MAG: hypothetical protein MJ237_08220 [bacterium]|nr:hypothetical protein [bacterium]